MFDDLFDSLKEKLDEISTSVDDKIKEAREQIAREDADKSSNGLLVSFIELVDEANDKLTVMFADERGPKRLTAPPPAGSQRSSVGAGSSRSNLDTDDDLLGYNLSDTSEDERELLGGIPTIRSIQVKSRAGTSNHLSPDGGGAGPYPDLNLTDVGGQPLPRYALPSVYLRPSEVCKRRVTTTKRITEADLDKNSPLYRHRDQILGDEAMRKLSACEQFDPKNDHKNVSIIEWWLRGVVVYFWDTRPGGRWFESLRSQQPSGLCRSISLLVS